MYFNLTNINYLLRSYFVLKSIQLSGIYKNDFLYPPVIFPSFPSVPAHSVTETKPNLSGQTELFGKYSVIVPLRKPLFF